MRIAIALVLLVVAASCAQCGPVSVCTEDVQCNLPGETYNYCDVANGVCLCKDSRGCGAGETCNPLGFCQSESGCNSNDECDGDGLFCDTTTSQCLSVKECDPNEDQLCCTLDSHCPFGNICTELEKKCEPGCRDEGDCNIGQACVGGGLGRIGQCAAGVCTENNLCKFGELCNLEEASCVFDTRGPYCFSCTGGVASDDCGAYGNYCLTDTSDPLGRSSFCGVDCSQGQPCPFGYECHDVIIIPPAAPFCGVEGCQGATEEGPGTCSSSGTSCNVDEDCPVGPPGGDCPRADVGNCADGITECTVDAYCCAGGDCPEGSCIKQQCRGSEGGAFGHCTCTRDADCPRDRCLDADLTDPDAPIAGHCELSGHRCFEDLDCDTIACVEGGCLIGSNCAPANDRNCRELVVAE
jgi:hypothetical protein